MAQTARPSDRNVRWTLLGVMLAMLLAMMDNTIVGTAMPTITADIRGVELLSWVVTAYVLATAISTPVWGKYGDLRGRKNIFLASIVLFLIGSVACGLAQTMGQLIGFRVVQGLGAGGLTVLAFALIGDLVPPRDRGRYQGMIGAVMAVGVLGGPLAGGCITDHIGWRWAFFINLPIGLVALVWTQITLRLPAVRREASIDWLGVALLSTAISALVLAASWAGVDYAWASWQILGLFGLTAAATIAFVISQNRATEPVLPMRIFKDRNIVLISILTIVVGALMFSSSLYLPLFQQSVQGASASNSGLLLLPLVLTNLIVSQIPGQVMTRTGRYKIFPIIGAILLTIGTALLATMTTDTSRLTTGIFMAIVGAGLGLTMQTTITIAQNSAEPRDLGAATAAITLFRPLGGSVAVAVFGALLTRSVTGVTTLSGPDYAQAVATGTQHIYWAACALCALAIPAMIAIKEVPLRSKTAGPTPAPTAPKVTAAK